MKPPGFQEKVDELVDGLNAKYGAQIGDVIGEKLNDPEFFKDWSIAYKESLYGVNRSDILDKAKHCVSVERNATYGEPKENHEAIATLWNAYLAVKKDRQSPQLIHVEDVSVLLILMKVARLGYNPSHLDSWIDVAGYAACGGEISSVGERTG